MMRILVMGASGSGTTTLGAALAGALGGAFFDGDGYYWVATDPPFQQKRDAGERVAALTRDLEGVPVGVVAGSVMGWGRALEDSFELIVFLTLPAALRVERLRARELATYGRVEPTFLAWAAQYDEGTLAGRSRVRHERWLAERTTPILRIDGDVSTEERIARVRCFG